MMGTDMQSVVWLSPWRVSRVQHQHTAVNAGIESRIASRRGLEQVTYGIARIQPLAAKETTSRRKEIVQRSRPWEKAPTYLKAQEKAQKAVAQQTKKAPRKKTARA